jgi:hypothetical protein
MAFKKKGDRVDVHIWLDVQHCATLDAIAKKYQISRAQVMAGLLEEYEERAMRKDHVVVGPAT